MCTLGWANHKTDMESRDLGEECQMLAKRQDFDFHEANDFTYLQKYM